MAYSEQTWNPGPGGGTPVNVARLQHMEDGIAAAVPKWTPNTAYASGEFVLNPSGQIVSANTAFTSGASYSATNWTVVSGGGGSTVTATDNGDGTITLVAS